MVYCVYSNKNTQYTFMLKKIEKYPFYASFYKYNKPQWPELPLSRTNFHSPKGVQAIEVRLFQVNLTVTEVRLYSEIMPIITANLVCTLYKCKFIFSCIVILPNFSAIFTKGNNYHILFASVDADHPKWCLLIKEVRSQSMSKFFSLQMDLYNKNDKASSCFLFIFLAKCLETII